jgi:hypothetical protein
MDSLWSCLFTIFACTWTIQHLNIPEQRERRDPGWRGNLKWKLKGFWTSLKWMVLTMVAPKLPLAKALSDLIPINAQTAELKKFAAEDGVTWTSTHTLFANMGGFVLRSNAAFESNTPRDIAPDSCAEGDMESAHQMEDLSLPKVENVQTQPTAAQESDSLEEVAMHSESVSTASAEDASRLSTSELGRLQSLKYHNPFHLTAAMIIRLHQEKLLSLPQLMVEEIDDKSKSDTFVRAIAIVQITWIIVQVVVRAVRGLAVSQLEIAVVAFSTCAIIIYAVNWKKPKGVQVPHTLTHYPGRIPADVLYLLEGDESDSNGHMFWIFSNYHRPWRKIPTRLLGSRILNDTIFGDTLSVKKGAFICLLGFAVSCAAFGGLHILGWNFIFPTRSEQIAWGAAIIWCATYLLAVLVVCLLIVFCAVMLNYEKDA